MPLGSTAPHFSLPDTTGDVITLESFSEQKALAVIFMCNHCPYVQHIRSTLAQVAKEYQAKNIGFVGINANDAENYPDDSPEAMKQEVAAIGYTFPYLYDETQQVAQAYTAACTPDIFVFDQDRKLVYRGQFDSSRPGNDKPVTGESLTTALDALLADQEVSQDQQPSSGCNIKWKPGNEPNYTN